MKHFLLPAAVVLSLAACAGPSSDLYRPADSPGGFGYSEVRLDEDRYRVSFTGNGALDDEAVKELALLRASELTREEGYDWFRVVAVETEERTRTLSSPDQTTIITGEDGSTTVIEGDREIVLREEDDAARVTRECGALGCTTTVTPEYTGPEIITTRSSDSVATTIEIEMGDGSVVDPTTVYNANLLYDYLEDRYTA